MKTRKEYEISGTFVYEFFTTSIARFIAGLGHVFLALLVARMYGVEMLGLFALAIGAQLIMVKLARRGLDLTIMKFVSHDPDSSERHAYLASGIRRSSPWIIVVSLALLLLREHLANLLGHAEMSILIAAAGLSLPPFVLCFMLSGYFKAIGKPASASLLENGSVAIVMGLIIATLGAAQIDNALLVIGISIACAPWIVLLHALWTLHRIERRLPWSFDCVLAADKRESYNKSANDHWIITIASGLHGGALIVLAAPFLSASDIGLLDASLKLATILVFIQVILNTLVPPRLANAYAAGDSSGFARLARQASLIGFVLGAPYFLLCILFPGQLLAVFGEEFRAAVPFLLALSVAQFINVSLGCVSQVLNMAGHHSAMRNISLATAMLACVLVIPLSKFFGAYGFVSLVAATIMIQNFSALLAARRLLGVWVIPGLTLGRA
jgi:O-antigen/teichoic acid export membrane protein